MFETEKLKMVTDKLKVDPRTGLTQSEAQMRLAKDGPNELKSNPPKTGIEMFLEQLNDPLIFILFAAAAISLLLHEISDMIIIFAVILINAVIGVVQEGKAQKALDALKKMTSPTALVKRDGAFREIPAKELVAGDIVALEAGRQVPADLRLISSASLKMEESALTGESVPVEKDAGFTSAVKLPLGDQKNVAFMSTNAIYGRAEGVVTAVGMNTEIGRIAGMINDAEQEATPLQKRLGDLGKLLSILAVGLCAALFLIAVWQQREILDMLITAISLAVAAVPEGLPAVVTIVLALSVSKMVKVNTIIRRLPSVETLGAVSIVCSDKTGTLTQNKMTVMECYMNQQQFPVTRLSKSRHEVFLNGFMLCNDASIINENRIGDPTELAFLEMGKTIGVTKEQVDNWYPRTGELPFDSERKMMTTIHKKDGRSIAYTKGSGDEILRRCTKIYNNGNIVPISAAAKREIEAAMKNMASKALRVLALGMKENAASPSERDLIFVGLAGMIDPARPEALNAIRLFKDAGVRTIMITGDHIETALAIAKKLEIAEHSRQCISGTELNTLNDRQLTERIDGLRVFARVSPEHKVRIVNAFRTQGRIVAMTGDGVNDAPSLKTADIGIAMGMSGTDVAKNASDIILTDDNFATIEKAIEEGRGIYENIKKSVLFLLSSNFGEIIAMFISVLAGFASPLKASHILWVNLITDSLPGLALGVDENDNKMLMKKRPRNPDESLFAHGGMACILFYGGLIAVLTLTAFLVTPYTYIRAYGLDLNLATLRTVLNNSEILIRSQTYAFTVLGLSELFHAIGMRNVEKSVFRMNHTQNKLMLAAFFVGIVLQVAVTEIPYLVSLFETVRLSTREWIGLGILSAGPLLAHELLIILSPKRVKMIGKDNTNNHQPDKGNQRRVA